MKSPMLRKNATQKYGMRRAVGEGDERLGAAWEADEMRG